MTMLVEDLLLLARLDAGRPLQFEQTDLIPLVVDTVSDARVAGRSHSWRLDLPDMPALVSADAARLQQVLVNLLANARTHTPPGTTVTARVQRRGPWMCVDVEDDGQGIPEELLLPTRVRMSADEVRADGAGWKTVAPVASPFDRAHELPSDSHPIDVMPRLHRLAINAPHGQPGDPPAAMALLKL